MTGMHMMLAASGPAALAASATDPAVDESPGSGSCTYDTGLGGTSCTAIKTSTCTATGGVPPYSYSWSHVSGDAFTLSAPTSATTEFSRDSAAGTYSGVYRCQVTDSLGTVVNSNNVTVSTTHTAV